MHAKYQIKWRACSLSQARKKGGKLDKSKNVHYYYSPLTIMDMKHGIFLRVILLENELSLKKTVIL